MITVSIKNLVEAIRETDVFTMPEMNEGTDYLYNTVYHRISEGHAVRLSELDFDAFKQEDVETLNDLYSDIFERNYQVSGSISSILQALTPVCKAVGYV